MLDKRTYELLNQEADGANTPRDGERVKAILERSAEAREVLAGIKELSAALKSVPDVDPPRSLKARILNSLPHAAPRPSIVRPPAWIQLLFQAPSVRLATSFAGGAVAGILLFAMFSDTPQNSSRFVGTIGNASTTGASVSVNVVLPLIQGTITAERVNGLLRTRGNFKASEVFDLRLTFDQTRIEFESFQAERPSHAMMDVSPGVVRISSDGDLVSSVSFRMIQGKPAPIRAEIYVRGERRFEHILTFDQSSQESFDH
ncbi:MAG: hypothetical protein HY563_03170 [Ignavibacteriales bacterium]|nr:hypothetical protein [Ignavibacteriales bacterium]